MGITLEEKNLEVGQRLVRDRLVKVGTTLIELATADAAKPEEKGWTPARTQNLKKELTESTGTGAGDRHRPRQVQARRPAGGGDHRRGQGQDHGNRRGGQERL